MKDQNTKTSYDVLMLMDFSEASYMALKYTLSMAKLIKCNIHVFHVANGEKIVTTNNQAAALRAIELETRKVEKKLNSIVEIIIGEGSPATSQYSFGNIINELENQINRIQPHLVVIGKKKENTKLVGKLTSYLLNKYAGSLLVIEKESEFQTNTKISVGCNHEMLKKSDPYIVLELSKHTKSPITFFTVRKPTESTNTKISIPNIWQSSIDKNSQCEYEENSTIALGLTEHILKENIELLCIGRAKRRNYFQNLFPKQASTISKILTEVHIPLLIMGDNFKSIN